MKKSLNTSAPVTADSRKGQRATETFRAQYSKAGLDEDGAQRLNEHAGFAAYLLAGIRRFSAKTPDYALAQSILGADFITPEEVTKARPSIVYTDEQITALAESLPSQDVLKWCKEKDHAVIPAPPTTMSLFDVRAVKADFFYLKGPDHDDEGWYDDSSEKFAKTDKVEALYWIAFRKEPVEDSLLKEWPEQQALVKEPMVIPNAAEAVWALTTYKAVRDIYLLEEFDMRTSSVDSDGDHVSVGHFDFDGLDVSVHGDDDRDSDLGVSEVLNLESLRACPS